MVYDGVAKLFSCRIIICPLLLAVLTRLKLTQKQCHCHSKSVFLSCPVIGFSSLAPVRPLQSPVISTLKRQRFCTLLSGRHLLPHCGVPWKKALSGHLFLGNCCCSCVPCALPPLPEKASLLFTHYCMPTTRPARNATLLSFYLIDAVRDRKDQAATEEEKRLFPLSTIVVVGCCCCQRKRTMAISGAFALE